MYPPRTSKLTAGFVALIIAILACNRPSAISTPDLALVVAQTQTAIAVEQFLTSTAKPLELPQLSVTPAQVTPTIPIGLSPSPSPTPTSVPGCTNKAKYVTETIPDGTPFSPGEKFIKSWTLQNSGTCTWTSGYSLVFFNGEQMSGVSPINLGSSVPPGETAVVTINLTAPNSPGEYQGFWKLTTPQNASFGLGNEAASPVWVKIIVTTGSAIGDLNLGAPTWKNSFDNKPYFF